MSLFKSGARNGYKIDKLYVDRFWSSISDEQWILIGSDMLLWMGYRTDRARQAKELYVKLLSKHFTLEKDYKQLSASELGEKIDITCDVNILDTHGNARHLVVCPD